MPSVRTAVGCFAFGAAAAAVIVGVGGYLLLAFGGDKLEKVISL